MFSSSSAFRRTASARFSPPATPTNAEKKPAEPTKPEKPQIPTEARPQVQPRSEVKEAVKEVVAAGKAKAAAKASPSAASAAPAATAAAPKAAAAAPKAAAAAPKAAATAAAPAAPAAKEKVKAEKTPKEEPASGAKQVPVVPAQVPSPSVTGVVEPPKASSTTTTMVADKSASATYRSSPAPTSQEVPPPAPRTPAVQASGALPSGGSSAPVAAKVAEAAAVSSSKMPVPVPQRAVEVVSRTPVPATVSMPPTATPVPTQTPPVGFASALSTLAQGAAKTLGYEEKEKPKTSTTQQEASMAKAAPPAAGTVPKPATATASVKARSPVGAAKSAAAPPMAKSSTASMAPKPATAPSAPSAAPKAAATGGTTAPKAPPTVPKQGPAAVAVGRSVVRGAYPAIFKTPAGKLATPIDKKYQIVFVSSEVAPWSKTGGLGEAMDGLPNALAAMGHRVMTIAPRYDQYEEAWDTGYWSSVPMGDDDVAVHAFHAYKSKVDRVFLDHDCFLAKVQTKTASMLYGPEWGKDFADNQWRFIYFAKAVLKVIQELPLGGFPYGSNCIVVVNDWHSSMVPVYLALEKEKSPKTWAGTYSALLIHNAVFQGRFDTEDPEEPAPEVYGLPESTLKKFTFSMPLKVGRTEPKIDSCINWMAGAALHVDRCLTVSPTYAWELLNMPEMGVELEEIFQKKGMIGIVNGVKEAVSPMNESFVTKTRMLSTFSAQDVDEKKAELKAMLQELYDLPVSAETPLCIFVGRMDLQKGYDYILAALSALLPTLDIQIIIIGTGRADLVSSTKALAQKFPEKVYLAGWCGPERYAMVAGADFNLMPSRWEPCGLAQMESMCFGTLPLVAQTGGLVDTVEDGVTGVHLEGAVSVEKELDPSSVELVAKGIERCATIYKSTEQISRMRKLAMAAGNEYTWSNAALQYEAVFEEMGAVNVLPTCKGAASVTLEEDKAVA